MPARPLLKPLVSGRRPRPKIVSISVLPTLLTAGNVLAGLVALAYLMDAWGAPTQEAREHLWAKASWMMFVGMLCDLFDGQVARLTGTTSAFGAELDSLADVVTSGLAPALLAKSLIQDYFTAEQVHPRWATGLVAVYALGAAVRLARYNVESARAAHPGHVTRVFRGLPTPGAAGVIASLALLRVEYQLHALGWAFLIGAPVLGLLMVSRFPYAHVMNRLLAGRQAPVVVVILIMLLYVVIHYPEATAAALFGGYALAGPVLYLTSVTIGRPRWAVDEEADEDEDDPDLAADGETS